MRFNLHFDVTSLLIVAPITFLLAYFALDRDPPYVRLSGRIVPADPKSCNLEPDTPRGLAPGACVSPQWDVRSVRQCSPAPGYPVQRWLIHSTGNRVPIGSAKSEYPQQAPEKPGETAPLKRYFVLPLSTPEGPTEYDAEACFTCNPLQHAFPNQLAVCVTSPHIKFTVQRP